MDVIKKFREKRKASKRKLDEFEKVDLEDAIEDELRRYKETKLVSHYYYNQSFLRQLGASAESGSFRPLILNYTNAGASYYQRIGRKICMLRLELRINLFMRYNTNAIPSGLPSGAGTEDTKSNYIRFLVVYDKQANGTQLVRTDVLMTPEYDGTENATSSAFGTVPIYNRKRFEVLYDNAVVMPPYNPGVGGLITSVGATPKLGGVYASIDLGKRPVLYSGEGTLQTFQNIATGALWLCVCSDVGYLSTGNTQLGWGDGSPECKYGYSVASHLEYDDM